jgi:hypothetical protein
MTLTAESRRTIRFEGAGGESSPQVLLMRFNLLEAAWCPVYKAWVNIQKCFQMVLLWLPMM